MMAKPEDVYFQNENPRRRGKPGKASRPQLSGTHVARDEGAHRIGKKSVRKKGGASPEKTRKHMCREWEKKKTTVF